MQLNSIDDIIEYYMLEPKQRAHIENDSKTKDESKERELACVG